MSRRYCDYDAIEHTEPGKFFSNQKTDLKDALKEIKQDCTLPDEYTASFKDSQYKTYKTIKSVTLFRLFGKYQQDETGKEPPKGAGIHGRYASTEFAESLIDAKMRLALDPKWLSTRMYEEKILIPVGTTLSIGLVAPVVLSTGTILPGGAEQVILPEDWSETWIQGYRRVTSRQIRIFPTYWPEKPEEVSIGREKLYPSVCPRCGYERIRKLPAEEWIEYEGSKGGKYCLKRECMNRECMYCW